jgi:succinylglutamic semialdehyde dehydrogenase
MLTPPSNLIAGVWEPLTNPAPGNSLLRSHSPADPARVIWDGSEDPTAAQRAVSAARVALPMWSRLGLEGRVKVLRRFQQIAKQREDALARLLCDEVGKVLWDAKAEAGLLASKVDITLDAAKEGGLARVTPFELALTPSRTGRCDFRPHGVMAVIGPFNFPMHLPNGHIVPALAMGNTIVFKPSDKAPASGQALVAMFDQALRESGLPEGGRGVINLVQGGAKAAQALVAPASDIDGVLFTGSWPVGRAIMQASLDAPGRILALEMGGNNAAIVMGDCDLRQAVIECCRSAFIGTGQRCTCTRRIIVHESVAPRFITAFCKTASSLIIGPPDAPGGYPVFMGPLVSSQARDVVLEAQRAMADAPDGARVLVPCTEHAPIAQREGAPSGWYCTPGVVQVEAFNASDDFRASAGADVEVFGPLVRISVTRDLDDALRQANATRFGLAASLFSKDAAAIDRFLHECRAGCLNVNTGTAGASSKLPFGGLGLSGNHRPAGSFSTDYCAYPVASMLERGDAAVMPAGMRFEEGWMRGE